MMEFDIVAVSMAFYPDPEKDSGRLECAKNTCKAVLNNFRNSDLKFHMVIINDPKSHPGVKDELKKCGGNFVTIVPQTSFGGKGVALREGIRYAEKILRPSGVVSFQELEKSDFISKIEICSSPILKGEADVIVPKRTQESFKKTYAKEQYHSEMFANYYVNNLLGLEGEDELDIYFGPFLFIRELADKWLDYDGKSWDAQMVPMLRAKKNDSTIRIKSVLIDYQHEKSQKQEEEGSIAYCQKRLIQLNNILPVLHAEFS